MTAITLDRVPVQDMTPERFERDYLLREHPVVVTGVSTPLVGCSSLDDVAAAGMFGASMKRQRAWYDAPLPPPASGQVPSLVLAVLSRPDVSVRAEPMRLWAQPGGHRTLFHYDGNSVSSLNLQLTGRKRWSLVSADTPLPTPPFQQIAMVRTRFRADPTKYDVADCVTEPGDMLFVPRYWSHAVDSLAESNINANWVWTPHRAAESVAAQRERDLVALRRMSRVVDWMSDGGPVASYGGDGAMVAGYCQGIGTGRMVQRVVSEVAKVPQSLLLGPSLLKQVSKFASANFAVPQSAQTRRQAGAGRR